MSSPTLSGALRNCRAADYIMVIPVSQSGKGDDILGCLKGGGPC